MAAATAAPAVASTPAKLRSSTSCQTQIATAPRPTAAVSTPHATRSATRRRCALRVATRATLQQRARLRVRWQCHRARARIRAAQGLAPSASEGNVGQRWQRRVCRRGFSAPQAAGGRRKGIVVARARRIGLRAAPVRRSLRPDALGRQRRDGGLGSAGHGEVLDESAAGWRERNTAPRSGLGAGAKQADTRKARPERRQRRRWRGLGRGPRKQAGPFCCAIPLLRSPPPSPSPPPKWPRRPPRITRCAPRPACLRAGELTAIASHRRICPRATPRRTP